MDSKIEVMNRTYSGESMIDISEDIDWAFNKKEIETDEHGFIKGKIRVVITIEDDEYENF